MAQINGTNGNDTIVGTDAADTISALGGLDRGERGRVGPHPDTFAAIPEKDGR